MKPIHPNRAIWRETRDDCDYDNNDDDSNDDNNDDGEDDDSDDDDSNDGDNNDDGKDDDDDDYDGDDDDDRDDDDGEDDDDDWSPLTVYMYNYLPTYISSSAKCLHSEVFITSQRIGRHTVGNK